MKVQKSNHWQRLAAPPLIAWLGACGAQAAPTLENRQSEPPRAGMTASSGGAGGSLPSAAVGGSSQPTPIEPSMGGTGNAPAAAGGGGMIAAGSGTAGSGGMSAAGTGGQIAHAGSGVSDAGAPAAGAAAHAGQGGAAGGGNAGAGGMMATGATFTQVYAVFTAGCSCHGSGAGGLTMSSLASAYANLVGKAASACSAEQRVVTGDPDKSVLFHALARTDLGSCKVPKMPAGGAMLSAGDLELVRSWIAAGALNN